VLYQLSYLPVWAGGMIGSGPLGGKFTSPVAADFLG